MKSMLIRLGLMALIFSVLSGCGGSDGATGATGAPGAPGTPGTGGSVVAANLTAAQWLALKPNIDPASISVTINSPPVVKFRVTDQYGNPLIGLGGQRKSSTALVPTNYNMFFTLAKLVPVTGGPSKWVNYLVTKPAATGTANASVDANGKTWLGTYPTPD